jgi:hypothetical protein
MFKPPAVSRWYRFDWQYAVDVASVSLFQQGASLIAVILTILSSSSGIFPSLPSANGAPIPLWFLWVASVAFLLAWVLLYLRCPKFVREYRDFGQYATRQHSHRWILWEFYNNLESLAGWEGVVRETSSKGLTTDAEHVSQEVLKQLDKDFLAPPMDKVRVFKPVNFNRDLYLPIHIDGRKLVLTMLETDTDLQKREKELFWILYSQAARERPVWRTIFWALMAIAAIAALLVSITVLYKIRLVLVGFAK